MLIKRFSAAQPYEAPRHHGMRAIRLQGFEAGGPQKCWVGLSYFLPGGGADLSASPLERVYVVLSGSISVSAGGCEVVLATLDSCCIPGGESRQVRNLGNDVAAMLVVMPCAEA